MSVDAVCHAGFDGVEGVEYVALHHDEVGHAVDHDGVFQGDEVDPPTTAFTAGDGTVFVTDVADFLSGLVKELGGEGAASHAGAIGFEYAIDFADAAGGYAQAGAGSGTDGVRRGDKGVGTEVDGSKSSQLLEQDVPTKETAANIYIYNRFIRKYLLK